MAELIFWICLLLPFYAWIGYPLTLLVLGAIRSRGSVPASREPFSVSLIIAAHNEAEHIQSKLKTVLAQSYPASALEVIVASDGSTDETVELASAIDSPSIQVLDLPRLGKAQTLNTAVGHAQHEILVFTDADNQWATDTLEHLLAPMSDASVGCCSGTLVVHKTGRTLSAGDSWYRRYEGWLRQLESRVGCMVSADGALLALRRDLWQPIPRQVNDDFYLSTCAPVAGKRIVHVPQAVVLDHGVDEPLKQFRRRVRVTVGGLHSLAVRRSLMNPLRHGYYAIALISHKLVRRFAPVLLVPLFMANVALWQESAFYSVTMAVQLSACLAGIAGLLDRQGRLPRIFHLAGFFMITLAGMVVGFVQFICGRRYSLWNPQQSR